MIANFRVALLGSLVGAVSAHSISNTTAAIEYTTEIVTELTTYCPAPTTITHGTNTYTVTKATTLTITDCPCTITKPKPSHPVPTSPAVDCPSECSAKFDNCRVQPNANMATCSAEYAACLGYNPWGNGTFVTPTACSHGTGKPTTVPEVVYTTEVVTELTTYCPEPTTLTHNSKTYTVTKPTTLTITDCPCTVTKPIPTHSAPVPTSPADCPSECSAKFDACRSKPQANMATCSAEYAACLGYNPWNNGTFATPTACSHQPGKPSVTLPISVPTQPAGSSVPPTAPAPVPSNPTGPAPVPSNPTGPETVPTGTPTGPVPVPTGGAGQLAPFGLAAGVALMALL